MSTHDTEFDPSAAPVRARYSTAVPLASGGTAEVYRAYDEGLKRWVALKYLRAQRPALRARLLREARALAQVKHPGICEVYQIAEDRGRPYMAMRLVDGIELDEALEDASWRTIVRVVRDAADAVAAAHEAGLVHRDLKPPNILVERAPDGTQRPVVVDFGLVQDARRATILTEAGELLGTPHYMAPEQLHGPPDGVGPAADVWALGVTLAQLLSGGDTMPFEADNDLDLMGKILHEAPRLPDVGPLSLRRVLARCLVKSPDARYADARALRADLDRVLADRPVTRPPTRARVLHMAQRLRQHPVRIAIVVALAVVALAVLTLERRHRARLHSVEHYGQIGKNFSWTMRTEHMRPLQDLTPVYARLRARVATLEAELAALRPGSTAYGPLRYAIGEGYRALGGASDVRALAHLEAAWAAGFRTPDAGYALSAVLGSRIVAEWRALSPALQARVADLLQRGRDAQTASPDYVEALLALYERRYDDALTLAERAQRAVPWAYEIDRLIGEVHVARSRALDSARPAAVDAAREAAAAAYARAIERAPSDPESRVRLCQLHGYWLGSLIARPHAPGNDHAAHARSLRARGLARCQSALQIDLARAKAHASMGYLERQYGEYLRWQRDEDPIPHFGRAQRHLQRAVRMSPSSARVHSMLGDLYLAYGYAVGDPNARIAHAAGPRDARAYMDLAALHQRLAIRLDPHDALYPRRRASVASRRVWIESVAGQDPAASAQIAQRLHLAARRPDDSLSARADRAYDLFDIWHAVAHYAIGHDAPMATAVDRMRAALEGAGEPLTSTGWDLWRWGRMHRFAAYAAWGTGRDPRPALDAAARRQLAAHRLDPAPMMFVRAAAEMLAARIDAAYLLESVDPAWLAQQRAQLIALRDRAVDDDFTHQRIAFALWRADAQQRALGPAADPPVDDPPSPSSIAGYPSERVGLALWAGVAAAVRGDDAAVRIWRGVIDAELAGYATPPAEPSDAAVLLMRAMRHVLDASLAADATARAVHAAEVERLADAIVARNRWQLRDAQQLRLALAIPAVAGAPPPILDAAPLRDGSARVRRAGRG
ncbi:MAG: serine/threonine-protein kinase [Acidobacteriota bacterium]